MSLLFPVAAWLENNYFDATSEKLCATWTHMLGDSRPNKHKHNISSINLSIPLNLTAAICVFKLVHSSWRRVVWPFGISSRFQGDYKNATKSRMSVLIEMSTGEVVVDLFVEDCPVTTNNFLKLCKAKYFNNNLVFEVQRNHIIQTGDPTGTGQGGNSFLGLINESPTGVSIAVDCVGTTE
jgi:hypothetical protein